MTLVTPISATQIQWGFFIPVVEEALGCSPTRGLDSLNIKINEPRALLSLDCKNDPKHPDPKILEHIMISFAMSLDQESLIELLSYRKLRSYVSKARKGYFVIVSATLDVWFRCLKGLCSKDSLLLEEGLEIETQIKMMGLK